LHVYLCVGTNFLGKFKKAVGGGRWADRKGTGHGSSVIIKHTFYAANETLLVYI